MKISLLICTYKRNCLLEKGLKLLIEESCDLPDEIIIVDGDEGRARDIVIKWQEKFPHIKLIPTKNINLAASRNIGLHASAGDIVALTDDDVVVSFDWIRRIKELHEKHPEAGVIGGRVKSVGNKIIDKVAELVVFPFSEKAGYVRTVAGANASYKKEVIKKIGKYDESLFRGEDVDYNWRALQAGFKIYYDPNLIVYHFHRANWRELFYQIFMYGRAYYLVRKKWKDMYCVYPHEIRRVRDVLKLGYCLINILYEPWLMSAKIERPVIRFLAYPILVVNQFCWKCGMIRQALACMP